MTAVVVAVLAASLSACGFHLQGRGDYAPELESVYMEVPDRTTDLARQLASSLEVSGIKLVNRPEEATATLQIRRDTADRQVESVSANNRPQEYKVVYTAVYRVVAGDEVLLTEQRVVRSRTYTYDELKVLAKVQEEELIREDLARQIAGVITRRLATVSTETT